MRIPDGSPKLTAAATGAAALALALPACGGSDNGSRAATPTPAAQDAAALEAADRPVPEQLRGAFSVNARASDGLEFDGRWRLIMSGKRYRILNPKGEREGGDVRLSGDRLVFRDHGVCGAEPAEYTYELRGDALTLQLQGSDSCSGRQIALTFPGDPWMRG